jgi:tetratricopeptide (TPR) repeat protein
MPDTNQQVRAHVRVYAPLTLFERALRIREDRLGADHPYTATSLNRLASVLAEQGHLAGARPLYERALAIYEDRLGADHPATARSRRNLTARPGF